MLITISPKTSCFVVSIFSRHTFLKKHSNYHGSLFLQHWRKDAGLLLFVNVPQLDLNTTCSRFHCEVIHAYHHQDHPYLLLDTNRGGKQHGLHRYCDRRLGSSKQSNNAAFQMSASI
mmetsp:Transcript_24951/g.54416  ORF Transcript_24951/g.54416 Transcript_24951/m.54416 type:complete len:117 (-) Transcript_24951:819-1169(-)